MDRVETRSLLDGVFNAWKSGLPGHRDSGIDAKKIFSTHYLLKMGTRLSLPEVTTLLEAEKLQAEGLSRARGGDIAGSAKALRLAKEICAVVYFSYEASLAANTFQTAAEAYLHYKSGNFDDARSLIFQSIDSCGTLNDEFGYNMEMRRIHLGRNIIRIESIAGDFDPAMRHAIWMIRYIGGLRQFWPFPEMSEWRISVSLSEQEGWWCMDEILGDIAFLLTRPNPIGVEWHREVRPYLEVSANGEKFLKVSLWLNALEAAAEGNISCFLRNTIQFFSSEFCYLRNARRLLLERVVEECYELDPEKCSELRDAVYTNS